MWASIIAALLPLALSLVGRAIEHKDKEDEAVKAYYTFLEAMSKKPGQSARLRTSIQNQRQRIWDKLNSK